MIIRSSVSLGDLFVSCYVSYMAIFMVAQKCNRYGSCHCPCSSSSSSSFTHFDIHFSKPAEEGF